MSNVVPLLRTSFAFAEHQFARHGAIVPIGTTQEQLEDPVFWSHVRGQLTTFAEVRVVAEDGSMTALMLVTYADSIGFKIKTIYFLTIENPIPAANPALQHLVVKQRGQLKWCVVDTRTDKNIRQGINSQSDAMRELEEYQRALAA